MGLLKDKVYELKCECVVHKHEHASIASEGEKGVDLWHQQVGEQILRDMASKDMVGGVNLPKLSRFQFCEGCVEGKIKRKPFHPVGEI